MSKRPNLGFNLSETVAQKRKLDQMTRSDEGQANRKHSNSQGSNNTNPYLNHPIEFVPEIMKFLLGAKDQAKTAQGLQEFEIEARFGTLKTHDYRRVTSSGTKTNGNTGRVVPAFRLAEGNNMDVSMDSGVSKRHFEQRTQAGLSDESPISLALGVPKGTTSGNQIKALIQETHHVETVFAGYSNHRRVVIAGEVDAHVPPGTTLTIPGKMEYKEKWKSMDVIIPAANYDMRIAMASEKTTEQVWELPRGASLHRIKRRYSYHRRDDDANPWQIDVTEVTSTSHIDAPSTSPSNTTTTYEIELELRPKFMKRLIREESPANVAAMTRLMASKLWEMVGHLNPIEETVDVEESLQEFPKNSNDMDMLLAKATVVALKKFMESGQPANFVWPIATRDPGRLPPRLTFAGAMPINFSRHDIEKVQHAPDNGYFLSEKTDGVRHFMIFTSDNTVLLVDRAMNVKRVKPLPGSMSGEDPMTSLAKLVEPGTVLDGEVVMHRGGPKHKARPVFIVFDVLMVNSTTPILHYPFHKRLQAMQQVSFRRSTTNPDRVFSDSAVADLTVALPLVRKNFVNRHEIADLFGRVVEERGFRSYRHSVHHHLTDGIIFQPDTAYKCGTDRGLLKWKYLDTATIDVRLLTQDHHSDEHNRGKIDSEDTEYTIYPVVARQTEREGGRVDVDMKRYVKLPKGDFYRLRADQAEAESKQNGSATHIAEVGLDPASGEWYYLTMRPDKTDPNHISTVLGTFLELGEGLTAAELQYKLSLRSGERDNWARELQKMMQVLLKTQQLQHKRKASTGK